MGMRRLDGVDGFVVSDLDGVERHGGVARCAPKVLADSAWLLARCATYQFAAAGYGVGGASVGINAPADARQEVVAAAVAALGPQVADGLTLDAGKGLSDEDLAPLHALDRRPAGFATQRHQLTAEGIAAAIAAVRSLDGATVALDTLDPVAVALAEVLARRGARVVTVGSGTEAITNPDGLDPTALADAVAAGGDAVASLGAQVDPATLLGSEADVLAVGAKLGAIDHQTAAGLRAGVVAPTNWVPVTTRALAVLGRAGVTVLPDFVALAGALPASGLNGEPPADPSAAAADLVGGVIGESAGSVGEDWPNLVLAACARAEAFLLSAGHDLPVSRPLG